MLASMFTCLVAVTAALLHPAATEVPSEVSARRTVVVCDGFKGLLKCPPNSLIEVHTAFNGRTSDQYCATGPRHTYGCDTGPRALAIARAKCNNRQSCHITSHIFGDPCPGTYKYMQLTYSCRALSTAVACDDTQFRIQCPAGKYIWIRDGFFGRVSDEHCSRGPRTDYTCALPNAKDIISSRCNNKGSCAFYTNSMSDPCHGTFKYITAAYECLDHETKVVCDGDPNRIECPANKVIRVHNGFYGRKTDEYCAHGPRHTYECEHPAANVEISKRCNNNRFCDLPNVGDPCPNTLKMAIVKYTCV